MNANKMTVRENHRVFLSRHMLQEALLCLLKKKQIQQISVVELCREASVNRSTFYRLYSIPIEVMEDILQERIREIGSMITLSGSTKEENTRIICRYIYDNRDVFLAIINNDDQRISSMLEKKICNVLQKDSEFFESEEKCLLVCSFLTAGGLAITRRWLETENSLSPEEMSEIYQSFFMATRWLR